MTSAKSILSRLGLSLLTLLAFVVIVEGIVRLIGVDTYFQNRFFTLNRALDYPDVFKKDRTLFWRLRPNQTITSRFFEGRTYRINSLGLRGENIGPKTKPRILTIGNSCTFGWRIADSYTYAEQLQRLLLDDYQVINAGIPGYTSLQGRRFFESDLLALEPDIVTILFSWNDHWAAGGGIADKDQKFPPSVVLAVQNALSRLHTYRLLKKAWLSAIEPNPDSLFDRSNIIYRVELDDYRENLTAICRTARSRGITPILLTSPIPSLATYYPPGARSGMHRYHAMYNDVVRQVALSEHVSLVDLALEFDNYDNLWDDVNSDPFHFNTEGHRIAAELIAENILEDSATRTSASKQMY